MGVKARITWVCDRCAANVNDTRTLEKQMAAPWQPPDWVAVSTHQPPLDDTHQPRPIAQLCPTCASALTVWLATPPVIPPAAGT